MPNLTYRNATIEDLPLVVAIYNSTIESRMVTADIVPVSVESKIEWFREHKAERTPLWMIEDEHGLVGWAAFQLFHKRPAYHHTIELSIYLDEAARGKGYGKQILQHCIAESPSLGIKTLLGLIFAHNIPSLKLFRNCGFEDWALLPDVAELDGIERSLIIVGRKVKA